MDYFKQLTELLNIERADDRASWQELSRSSSIIQRRTGGLAWYPIAIRDTELGRGDYLTVEVERTTHLDITHQFRSGATAAFFSNHDPEADRIEGTIGFVGGHRLRITLPTDELPEWARNGKLGIELLFDDNSYTEMFNALKQADALAEKSEDGLLVRVLTGLRPPAFDQPPPSEPAPSEPPPSEPAPSEPAPSEPPPSEPAPSEPAARLNPSQQTAVKKILSATDLAIIHGPPGTGKTTTLVHAIHALIRRDNQPVLVTAPSNAAVDLLSEKLSGLGLNVLRIGNPARVSDAQQSLTLDSRVALHPGAKDIKKLKKKASEFRDMAHKYKRSFGPAEREQRKALFDEARNLIKDVERIESNILNDLFDRAQVITATLVGANHPTLRNRRFQTAVIDEAGQALEPASWIPALKTRKLILAGDHCQLPPTIRSAEASRRGLNATLMERNILLHPEAVTLLDEQYRMHEHIMRYSSSTFYEDRLHAHPSVANHRLFEDDSPLTFIDTAGCGFEEKREDPGLTNPEEAAFLLRHAARLTTELESRYPAENFPTIGIISPYRLQVQLLQELLPHSAVLQRYAHRITVNTIDSFQGQERDIIYIGMTRSNTDSRIGFLAEIRRMNVAMTRARKKLIVIGDSATLAQTPFYAGFIDYAEKIGSWRSAWEFFEE